MSKKVIGFALGALLTLGMLSACGESNGNIVTGTSTVSSPPAVETATP